MNGSDIFIEAINEGVYFSLKNDSFEIHSENGSISEYILSLAKNNKNIILSFLKAINNYGNVSQIPIEKRNLSHGVMSIGQERLWFINELHKNKYYYNHQTGMGITGSLNIKILSQAINHVINENPILRTNLKQDSKHHLVQTANDEITSLSLEIVELEESKLKNQNLDDLIDKICLEKGQKTFDLSKSKLVRFHLIKKSYQQFYFVVTMHHSITDGWSFSILFDEIWEAYKCLNKNKTPEKKYCIEYLDFSYWQKMLLKSNLFNKQRLYWLNELADLPISPTLSQEKTLVVEVEKETKENIKKFEINAELSRKIKSMCVSEQTIPAILLLSSFYASLALYTGKNDIPIGMPTSNRHHPQLTKVIGFLINTVVIRLRFTVDCSFISILNGVKRKFVEAYNNQDIPFNEIVKAVQPHRSLNSSPLFQIMFSYQNIPVGDKRIDNTLLVSELREHRVGGAKYDLNISIRESGEKFSGFFEYSNDLFHMSTVDQLCNFFISTLEIVTNCKNISLKKLFNSVEKNFNVSHINNETQSNNLLKTFSVIEMFEHQVTLTPKSPALFDDKQTLSYEQLNIAANHLAIVLKEQGVKESTRVGLHLKKSFKAIIAILSIFKCGACYIPIDISSPLQRKRKIVDNSKLDFIIVEEKSNADFDGINKNKYIDIGSYKNVRENSRNFISFGPRSDSLAYVIYTSGTTGSPKGVMVSHQALANTIASYVNKLNLDDTRRVLQYAPLSFDVSISDIFSTLVSGAILYLTTKETTPPGQKLSTFLQMNKITDIHLTPSIFLFLEDQHFPYLKNIILGGEAFSRNLIHNWVEKSKIFNSYGATETTISVSLTELKPGNNEKVLIGEPIDNCAIYLLDKNKRKVRKGQIGEIHVAGLCLSDGYLDDKAQTSARFIPNPFQESTLFGKLYCTGDLARIVDINKYEFIGRNDNQIKLDGRRVEISEIQASLDKCLGISSSIILPYYTKKNQNILVAYFVANSDFLSISSVKRKLRLYLPSYMLPKKYIQLDKFPYTKNGKIDLSKIPKPTFNIEGKTWDDNPRNEIEFEISEIWKQLLNIDSVGINNSFFDLGGHSLLSLKLISRLRSQFGKEILISDFIENPTISYLSRKIKYKEFNKYSWTPIVKLKLKGSKPPVFCVHPAGGSVFCYSDLATQLNKADHPVYGIQAQGIEKNQPLIESIDEMAEMYLRSIRNTYPDGPYYLIGWSAGGIITYEIAQKMLKENMSIEFVGILDAYANSPKNTRIKHITLSDDVELLARMYINSNPYKPISSHLRKKIDKIRTNKEKLDFIIESSKEMGKLPSDISYDHALQLLSAFKNDCKIVHSYQPKKYQKIINIFRPKELLEAEINKPYDLGWGNIMGNEVCVHETPGNHMNMIYYPNAVPLSKLIEKCIEKLYTTT